MNSKAKTVKTAQGPEIAAGWHGVPAVPAADRLPSLDAFRGFVIAAMVFVNNLSHKVPNWMRHMNDVYGDKVDGYTFVDLVFPGFLFMVGFAIPLSFYSKMNQGVSSLKLLWRLLVRGCILLFLGLVMVNLEHDPGLNEAVVGMSRPLYATLIYASIILLCLTQPKTASARRVKALKILKILSAFLLAFLLWIYRAGDAGHLTWFQQQWWGILGLIGWAYMGSGILYLLFRGSSTALMGLMAFMACLDIGARHGLLGGLGMTEMYFRDMFTVHALVVTAGILLGNLFVGKERPSQGKVMAFLFTFGLGLYFASALLRPLYGINKNDGTVSWGLVAAAISCWVYLFFYWVIEVAKSRKWAEWTLIPVGQNALLAYIFSEGINFFFDATLGRNPFSLWWDAEGWRGVGNGVNMALVICVLAWLCTKAKVSMRL
jgi:predicted acyltransferase